jgi:hypothetical protein
MYVKIGDTTADVRVEAVMSMPRLGFNDNWFGWAQALMPLGIRPTKVTGAFWGQCLQRVFEQFVDEAEYLLTIDYDTFFTKSDVEHLLALAMTFQCDAIHAQGHDGQPARGRQHVSAARVVCRTSAGSRHSTLRLHSYQHGRTQANAEAVVPWRAKR